MEYNEWCELSRRMAVEYYAIEQSDLMVPAATARAAAEQMAAKERTIGTPVSQRWNSIVWSMGTALLALEQLGMAVTPASTGNNEPNNPNDRK